MPLLALLRKRIHFHVGLSEPTLPTVQAAGEDAPPRPGLGGSFSLGSLIPVAGLALTLIGGYTNLRSGQESTMVEARGQIAALQKDLAEEKITRADQIKAVQESQTRLYQRFNAEVVSRAEISDRFAAMDARQLQLYGTLLSQRSH